MAPIDNILKNIAAAQQLSQANQSLRIVAVVSGSDMEQQNWQRRFACYAPYFFNRDGSTLFVSLQEKLGEKTRQGNFLGTLLAYRRLEEEARHHGMCLRDHVVLLGMIFGRGERMSPFTQLEGNCKSAIATTSIGTVLPQQYLTAIEEALWYFVPVATYLEKGGFRGILDKWGDETEIASVDLTVIPEEKTFASYDAVKVVSVVKITEELARNKDWVVFDESHNIVAQIARQPMTDLIGRLNKFGIGQADDGNYYAGVSLGPAALSYDVLDIAAAIFQDEISDRNACVDFDPFLWLAIAMDEDPRPWESLVSADKKLQELVRLVPSFFSKIQLLKRRFQQQYGRKLNMKILDLGSHVYWADIGQHSAMREKYLAVKAADHQGLIARRLDRIPEARDQHGNIVLNSRVSSQVTITDSVIVNSRITGTGTIQGSVIKDSLVHNPEMKDAFVILSARLGNKTVLGTHSGLYKSIGREEIVLGSGSRSGTILTAADGPCHIRVEEKTDLKAKVNYEEALPGNQHSFAGLYAKMTGVSAQELALRRSNRLKGLLTEAFGHGMPLPIKAYQEPKIWGVAGIGEYWFGSSSAGKSAPVFLPGEKLAIADILSHCQEAQLAASDTLPLVKILTPARWLSIQFHDTKQELWVVTAVNNACAGKEARVILGFSPTVLSRYGSDTPRYYVAILQQYGKELNILLDLLLAKGCQELLAATHDIAVVAAKVQDEDPAIARHLQTWQELRRQVDAFYHYLPVREGDVIPIPAGTLHSLGPGVEVVEPQIPGPSLPLDDGATYPVRYYFPGYPRETGQKELALARTGELKTTTGHKILPHVTSPRANVEVEDFSDIFEGSGLTVHRLAMDKNTSYGVTGNRTVHMLSTVTGQAGIETDTGYYDIPPVCPDGEMLLLPAGLPNYSLKATSQAQILDIFYLD